MPWMLAATLPTGLLGLVVAGMLAASISTYAGYFLGWSSIIAQDIVAPLLRRDLSSQGRLLLTRVTVVALTVFIMIWSLVYDLPGPAYFYLQVTANLFMAPTLVAVVGGLYWRRASADRRGPLVRPRRRGLARLPRAPAEAGRGHGGEPELGAGGGRLRGRVDPRAVAPARRSGARRREGPGGAGMSWALFWLIAFVVAFGSFVVISLAIAVRGVGEIRELFRALEEERRGRSS